MHVPETGNPVAIVTALNEQRGCPQAMASATEMGVDPVDQMDPNDRKSEYYYLLNRVLPDLMDRVCDFRDKFPHGLVKRDQQGHIVSSLPDLATTAEQHVATGQFHEATYWAHDAVYRTIGIATEEWAKDAQGSPPYERINDLVDNERQAAYGGLAIQMRVASAANQAVNISCSFQQMTERCFSTATGRAIRPEEMADAHEGNIKLAMPLTRLHLLETRPLRKVLGTQSLPGGHVEVYTSAEHFVFHEGALQPADTRLVDEMAEYGGAFPDGRIGCPGAQYIPEIWAWTGRVAADYALPALMVSDCGRPTLRPAGEV
jgi:hypothetical protein